MDYLQHIDENSAQYKRIMHRRTLWEPFGREAGSEVHDTYTIIGDEVFMEIIGDQVDVGKDEKDKPWYYEIYDNMNMSDELIEQNYKRYKDTTSKYNTIKVDYKDPRGMTYSIYKTVPVEVEKFQAKYEVPRPGRNEEKTGLDKLEDKYNYTQTNKIEDNSSVTEADEAPGAYVPPSIRNKSKTELSNIIEQESKRKLIIRNIPRNCMEDDMANFLMNCGKLYDVRIHRDKFTGESKGFAFVKCESHEVACKIIEKYNRYTMEHNIIHIDFAEDKKNNRRGK